MPTIQRSVKEIIRQDIKVERVLPCCHEFNSSMNNHNHGLNAWGGNLTFGGVHIDFCPFCGEKVIYDDTVALPEGYIKKPKF